MKQNEGPADRGIRVMLGAAFAYAATVVAGLWVWIAGALAVLMLATASRDSVRRTRCSASTAGGRASDQRPPDRDHRPVAGVEP